MAKTNSRAFGVGDALAVSFFAVQGLIFAPVFGDGKNGLTYADDLFNKLSKGSSYFIPKLQKHVDDYAGRAFQATVKLDKPETAASRRPRRPRPNGRRSRRSTSISRRATRSRRPRWSPRSTRRR